MLNVHDFIASPGAAIGVDLNYLPFVVSYRSVDDSEGISEAIQASPNIRDGQFVLVGEEGRK